MKQMRQIFGLCLLLLWGCEKTPPPEEIPAVDFSRGTFVLNEGNFNWGNAGLDFIDAESKLHASVFQLENDLPLGDVAQSMQAHGGDLYVVVNNSGKILRLNGADLRLKQTYNGFTSPRYLHFVSPDKAYVTDLYADAIAIFNPETGARAGDIAVGGWTEEVLSVGGKTFVAQMGTDQVLVIDEATDALLDSFYVGREPNSMVLDAAGSVWVLCSGGLGEAAPRLVRFDPGNHSLQNTFEFPDSSRSPSQLAIDPSGQELYYLDGDVYAMGVNATALPTQAFISAGGRVMHRLQVHGGTGHLFVTDAVDYVQQGHVLEYDAAGDLQQSWKAGIIPGDLHFAQ